MTNKPAVRTAALALLIGGFLASRLAGNEDPGTPGPLDRGPLVTPSFEIRLLHGRLSLAGHTLSSQHEQDLLQIAESSYPDATLTSNFEPLGVVPDYWPDLTAQVLYLLAETDSSTAVLTTQTIDIRGVTGRDVGWESRLAAVQAMVPAHVSLLADTVVIDPSIDATEVCQRAFGNFDAGAINFEESGAVFRSSAYPRLQRVIALANTCPESRILITGHTDASGSEAANQGLSLMRANAVGNYLVLGGVDADRLQTVGLGSQQPIANNATRYGRSLNRRIEIELTPWVRGESLLGRR